MAMRGGQADKARLALEGLLQYEPSIAHNVGEVLAKIGLFPDVARPISDQLSEAMTVLKQ